ncbi:MAG: hypothetical protein DRI46_08035 [Chloroflexi bacterium]|nr:MAG: hypothetical protein DRI46_08035 [Chloroflexota bacterium]
MTNTQMNWETNEAQRWIENDETLYIIARNICLTLENEYELEIAIRGAFHRAAFNLFALYHPDNSVDDVDWVLLTDALLATVTNEIEGEV